MFLERKKQHLKPQNCSQYVDGGCNVDGTLALDMYTTSFNDVYLVG